MLITKCLFLATISAALLAMPVVQASPMNSTDGISTFTEIISGLVDTVQQTTVQFASLVLRASLSIIGVLYAPLAVVGIILYATRLNRYLGKELIVGALILAFFVEFILPAFLP